MSDWEAGVWVEEKNAIAYLIDILSSPHHGRRPQLICGDRGHGLLTCTWDETMTSTEEGGGDDQEDKEEEKKIRVRQSGKGWHRKRWMEDKRLHFYESVREGDWSNWLLVLQYFGKPTVTCLSEDTLRWLMYSKSTEALYIKSKKMCCWIEFFTLHMLSVSYMCLAFSSWLEARIYKGLK